MNRNLNDFDVISIRIASPDQIRNWAKRSACKLRKSVDWPCPKADTCNCGKVKKPETINYRTFKPEKDGLFCEAIFGPSKNWECQCGKYKRIKHRGAICERCNVEVTQSKVRREQMGYIELAAPVSHVWFFKGLPSRIGLFLDLTMRELERVIYFESYIVVETEEGLQLPIDEDENPKKRRSKKKIAESFLRVGQILSEEEHQRWKREFPNGFRADMGAAAVRELLRKINLQEEEDRLRVELAECRSKQRAKKLTKRLTLIGGFKKSGNRPEWMILEAIPVIPPDLRPLVALDGGRFATSDLNDLYRRVINRNNRLRRLMDLRAPDVIIRNEKRMLQEAVDALLDNGKHGRQVKGPGARPLKSLSDMLKGKAGRFRQNLLGKRVDYSGRSVIVVGPELELHQCGLPKEMAIELFKPFIIRKLQERNYAQTIKKAKAMTETISPKVWEVLEEVIQDHPVLLNRAPTLHRLGIQAFEPQLVEGRAIRIHPLVCKAFNADFDGDQMAVHLPLSVEAQIEAKLLMMATRNILKPAHGRAIAVPELDIILGCSFLTKSSAEADQDRKVPYFDSADDVRMSHELGKIDLHNWIDFYLPSVKKPIRTTVGRVLFNQIVPDELIFTDKETDQDVPFINLHMHSKELSDLVSKSFEELGNKRTVEFLHELKAIGFRYATLSGISISVKDLVIPPTKRECLDEAWERVREIDASYRDGKMSSGERYNRTIDIWKSAINDIQDELFEGLKTDSKDQPAGFNPVYIMADSGARSKKEPIRQISGLRGLMAKPSGEIIEHPIEACFREGLTVLEYFISTHGARKGLADTAIKTASSGYLTRKLVDVAQDVMITEDDCFTTNGIDKNVAEGTESIIGRCSAEDIYDKSKQPTAESIVRRDQIIKRQDLEKIQDVGVETIKVRSVLTCDTRQGMCAKCYGMDLSSGDLVDIGEAVGIIAAQSIGEPGTQLTMRTFHTGGTVSGESESQILAQHDGIIDIEGVELNHDRRVISRNTTLKIVNPPQPAEPQVLKDQVNPDEKTIFERYELPVGTILKVDSDQYVNRGDLLYEVEPFEPIFTKYAGRTVFQDVIEGETMIEDKATGLSERVIHVAKDRLPRIEIIDEIGEIVATYYLPNGAHLSINDRDAVSHGDILARLPDEASKSSDIVSGLPRVTELFEARKPKDVAFIATIDGNIQIEGISRGMRVLKIVNEETGMDSESYRVPVGKYLLFQDGDEVKSGDKLTGGQIDPHDILEVKGEQAVQNYLLDEVQAVYRSQGERINDKHIEAIVSQMLKKVSIINCGDTDLLDGQEIDRARFNLINRQAIENGEEPATAKPILQGITKASLSTESFISAASFQQTTKVLTDASVIGKRDFLRGLKENVIMGHLIPAGTGVQNLRAIEVETSAKAIRSASDTELSKDGLVGNQD